MGKKPTYGQIDALIKKISLQDARERDKIVKKEKADNAGKKGEEERQRNSLVCQWLRGCQSQDHDGTKKGLPNTGEGGSRRRYPNTGDG
ncbi:MAG: hypothetical protein WC514_01330 [Candidatus Paceibacterota bacterium]